MLKARSVNPVVMKDLNVFLVQNCIYKKGPISRIDIAAEIDASAATVSRVVEALLQKNIVKNAGIIETNSVGRKAELLEFNYDYGTIIGLYIRERRIDIALANLRGQIIAKDHVSNKNIVKTTDYLDLICNLIKNIINKSTVKNLLTISVSCFGWVDTGKGKILQSLLMPQLKDLPLKQVLESQFHVPVSVENDVNMAAIGEYSFYKNQDIHNLAYIEFGLGIGAGMIVEGKLYRGYASGAGELAYCLPDESNLYEDKRERGCLSAIIGLDAVEKKLEAANIPELSGIARGIPSLEKMMELYLQGHFFLRRLIDEVIDKMALAVCNYSCILNPQIIVIGGDYADAWGDFLLNRLRLAVENSYPLAPSIRASACDEFPELIGAIETALTQGINIIRESGKSSADIEDTMRYL